MGSERGDAGTRPLRQTDRAGIEALIPHRDPFLFVDRVVERAQREITTEWHVSADLECFRGHYPSDPVLPGVLITEFALQSGALLVAHDTPHAPQAVRPVVSRIESARFRRIVRPGTTLRARVALEQTLANARYLSATVSADGATVARLRLVLALAPAPSGTDG